MCTSLARPVWSLVFSLLLVAPAAVCWGDDGLRLQASATEVAKYQRIEFELAVPWSYRNPFDPNEVAVSLEIRAPSGETLDLPAFWLQAYERQALQAAARRIGCIPKAHQVGGRGSPRWRSADTRPSRS